MVCMSGITGLIIMCFALLALGQHLDYPFILAANRDEFTDRPAQAMHDWEDIPGLLAGRDMTSMGSWLALNRNDRRLALVTNCLLYTSPSPRDS